MCKIVLNARNELVKYSCTLEFAECLTTIVGYNHGVACMGVFWLSSVETQ